MSKVHPSASAKYSVGGGSEGTLKYNEGNFPAVVKDFFSLIDTDGSGELDFGELDQAAKAIRHAKTANHELYYLNLPEEVQAVLKGWDGDMSGSVSVTELKLAAEAQKALQKENRLAKRLLFGAVIVIIILAAATFVLSILANEASKDFRPTDTTGGSRRARALSRAGRRLDGHGMTSEVAPGGLRDEGSDAFIGTAPVMEFGPLAELCMMPEEARSYVVGVFLAPQNEELMVTNIKKDITKGSLKIELENGHLGVTCHMPCAGESSIPCTDTKEGITKYVDVSMEGVVPGQAAPANPDGSSRQNAAAMGRPRMNEGMPLVSEYAMELPPERPPNEEVPAHTTAMGRRRLQDAGMHVSMNSTAGGPGMVVCEAVCSDAEDIGCDVDSYVTHFQRDGLMYYGNTMFPESRQDVEEFFSMCDCDMDGYLTCHELRSAGPLGCLCVPHDDELTMADATMILCSSPELADHCMPVNQTIIDMGYAPNVTMHGQAVNARAGGHLPPVTPATGSGAMEGMLESLIDDEVPLTMFNPSFSDVFNLLDADGCGVLSGDQLHRAIDIIAGSGDVATNMDMHSLGAPPPCAFTEPIDVMHGTLPSTQGSVDPSFDKAALQRMDFNGDGVVTFEECGRAYAQPRCPPRGIRGEMGAMGSSTRPEGARVGPVTVSACVEKKQKDAAMDESLANSVCTAYDLDKDGVIDPMLEAGIDVGDAIMFDNEYGSGMLLNATMQVQYRRRLSVKRYELKRELRMRDGMRRALGGVAHDEWLDHRRRRARRQLRELQADMPETCDMGMDDDMESPRRMLLSVSLWDEEEIHRHLRECTPEQAASENLAERYIHSVMTSPDCEKAGNDTAWSMCCRTCANGVSTLDDGSDCALSMEDACSCMTHFMTGTAESTCGKALGDTFLARKQDGCVRNQMRLRRKLMETGYDGLSDLELRRLADGECDEEPMVTPCDMAYNLAPGLFQEMVMSDQTRMESWTTGDDQQMQDECMHIMDDAYHMGMMEDPLNMTSIDQQFVGMINNIPADIQGGNFRQECADLPPAEKALVVDPETGMISETSVNATDPHMAFLGCAQECGCPNSDPGLCMPEHLHGCPCMGNKAACFGFATTQVATKALRGMEPTAHRRTLRKLLNKAVYQNRLRARRLSKLLPHDRRRLIEADHHDELVRRLQAAHAEGGHDAAHRVLQSAELNDYMATELAPYMEPLPICPSDLSTTGITSTSARTRRLQAAGEPGRGPGAPPPAYMTEAICADRVEVQMMNEQNTMAAYSYSLDEVKEVTGPYMTRGAAKMQTGVEDAANENGVITMHSIEEAMERCQDELQGGSEASNGCRPGTMEMLEDVRHEMDMRCGCAAGAMYEPMDVEMHPPVDILVGEAADVPNPTGNADAQNAIMYNMMTRGMTQEESMGYVAGMDSLGTMGVDPYEMSMSDPYMGAVGSMGGCMSPMDEVMDMHMNMQNMEQVIAAEVEASASSDMWALVMSAPAGHVRKALRRMRRRGLFDVDASNGRRLSHQELSSALEEELFQNRRPETHRGRILEDMGEPTPMDAWDAVDDLIRDDDSLNMFRGALMDCHDAMEFNHMAMNGTGTCGSAVGMDSRRRRLMDDLGMITPEIIQSSECDGVYMNSDETVVEQELDAVREFAHNDVCMSAVDSTSFTTAGDLDLCERKAAKAAYVCMTTDIPMPVSAPSYADFGDTCGMDMGGHDMGMGMGPDMGMGMGMGPDMGMGMGPDMYGMSDMMSPSSVVTRPEMYAPPTVDVYPPYPADYSVPAPETLLDGRRVLAGKRRLLVDPAVKVNWRRLEDEDEELLVRPRPLSGAACDVIPKQAADFLSSNGVLPYEMGLDNFVGEFSERMEEGKNMVNSLSREAGMGTGPRDNSLSDGELECIFLKFDKNGDGKVTMPIPDGFCEHLAEHTCLSNCADPVENANGDVSCPSGAWEEFSLQDQCFEERRTQLGEREVGNILQGATETAVVARVRARMRRRLEELPQVAPQVRRLAGMPIEFLSSDGRRQLIDMPESNQHTLLTRRHLQAIPRGKKFTHPFRRELRELRAHPDLDDATRRVLQMTSAEMDAEIDMDAMKVFTEKSSDAISMVQTMLSSNTDAETKQELREGLTFLVGDHPQCADLSSDAGLATCVVMAEVTTEGDKAQEMATKLATGAVSIEGLRDVTGCEQSMLDMQSLACIENSALPCPDSATERIEDFINDHTASRRQLRRRLSSMGSTEQCVTLNGEQYCKSGLHLAYEEQMSQLGVEYLVHPKLKRQLMSSKARHLKSHGLKLRNRRLKSFHKARSARRLAKSTHRRLKRRLSRK